MEDALIVDGDRRTTALAKHGAAILPFCPSISSNSELIHLEEPDSTLIGAFACMSPGAVSNAPEGVMSMS